MAKAKVKQIGPTPKPQKPVLDKDKQMDAQILKLKVKLEQSGVRGDALFIAVARVFSNAQLLTYKKFRDGRE